MATLLLSSRAFSHGSEIPKAYTCEGEDLSPPLSWSGVPAGTKSLALIMEDPDAPDPQKPQRIWVHWVLYNLPPAAMTLPEGICSSDELPVGTLQGKNDWQKTGYGGPCPPLGRHRYFFTLYALDTVLPDLHQPTKSQLEQALEGHVLTSTQLMGTYQKKSNPR